MGTCGDGDRMATLHHLQLPPGDGYGGVTAALAVPFANLLNSTSSTEG